MSFAIVQKVLALERVDQTEAGRCCRNRSDCWSKLGCLSGRHHFVCRSKLYMNNKILNKSLDKDHDLD